jgi:hypothetical protein
MFRVSWNTAPSLLLRIGIRYQVDSQKEHPDPAKSSDLGEESLEQFFQRPLTMPDIGVDLRRFDTEERAKRVCEAVNSLLQTFGRS